jgi:hypothetical protein
MRDLEGVCLMGVYLMGMHLMGVHLTSVPHGRASHGCASHRCASHERVSHRRASHRHVIASNSVSGHTKFMRGARYVILVLVTVSVGGLRELLLRIKKGLVSTPTTAI